ncbi:MAG: glycosyltransferase [Coriobacteriia bacterium]|nr:glycosyltransferase [Coriobacteriia bacterium]
MTDQNSQLQQQPTFSIIVPVYQVEDYLEECLDSILAQTFTDFELVCINDGSTDGSPAILERYAQADSRMTVVHQTNAGLSATRNRGINLATGHYLLFVDSDDLISPETCQILAETITSHQPDIITFGANLFPPVSQNPYLIEMLSPRNAVYEGFTPQLLFRENSQPFACRSAFRADFLSQNSICFDQSLAYGEDALFYFVAYPQSVKTVLLSDKLYNYRISRTGSLMTSREGTGTKRINDHIEIVNRILIAWQDKKYLDKYPEWLWEWVLEFLAYDIATSSKTEQLELLLRLQLVIEPYIDASSLSKMPLMRSSQSIFRTILSTKSSSQPHISWFQLQRYRVARRLKLVREQS